MCFWGEETDDLGGERKEEEQVHIQPYLADNCLNALRNLSGWKNRAKSRSCCKTASLDVISAIF